MLRKQGQIATRETTEEGGPAFGVALLWLHYVSYVQVLGLDRCSR